MKRNIYYSSSSMIMTNKGKLICATKPSDLKIFEYSNLYYNWFIFFDDKNYLSWIYVLNTIWIKL